MHLVELTEAGKGAFGRLLPIVVAFDARLPADLTEAEIAGLRRASERLHANVRPGANPVVS